MPTTSKSPSTPEEILEEAIALNERVILITNQKAEKLKNDRGHQHELHILQLRGMYQNASDRRVEFDQEKQNNCKLLITQTYKETYSEDLDIYAPSTVEKIRQKLAKLTDNTGKRNRFAVFFSK